MRLAPLLREPLAHFLLIGLLLFLLYGWIGSSDDGGKRIVVTQARVDDMAREFSAQLGVSPTQQELEHLVDTYVRDEIVYREGMAMGLAHDDPVVRRRVLQKYQIILEEGSATTAPTDADLAAYLDAHRAKFARAGSVTFEQIYFATSGSPRDVERRFEIARRAAVAGADSARLGEETMLPRRLEAVSLDLVGQAFGMSFAKDIAQAPVGQWIGPVQSSYGAHLVRVAARAAPSTPPLNVVRGTVAREWEADRRRQALAANYQALRADYDVKVDARLTPRLASRE